ncbi:hypothetical protein AK812_SmicGene24196 [Symbiodinium microadriaticum]|uniref:Integrase catalytic domain-containing protein n=1 Tax=Symbiodinium microadriaticum TaxID=2951 RepID=A0A1Q9DFH5_SYMMI|nr:hypothetical protein AK812_SmicGene24196 [Symbiodinium microadriaticum]
MGKKIMIMVALMTAATTSLLIEVHLHGRDGVWGIACAPHSWLSQAYEEHHLKSRRINLASDYDLYDATTWSRLTDLRRRHKPQRLWFFLPCTKWSQWSSINYNTEEKRNKLETARRRERRMLWFVNKFLKETLDEDPDVEIYYEWPWPYTGWSQHPLVDLSEDLQRRGLRWLDYRIDGYNYGIMEENTTPSVLDEFQDDHLLSETDLEVFSLLSNSSEAMAREARAAKDYSYQTMENILMAAHRNLQPLASNNRRWGDSDTTRLLLGGYSHGAFARLTKNTRRYQEFTHYINDYLAHHVPHHTWTSLMISFNCGTTVHQDHHNLSGSQNVLHCLGHFEHGGLWLQGTPPDGYEVTRRRLMDGNCSNGHVVNARYRIVTFDPKTSHTTQAWRGFRITISSYTTRLLPQMTREDRAQLQRHSFRLTSSTTTSSMNQAVMMPVEASPLGGQDENQSVSNEAAGHPTYRNLAKIVKVKIKFVLFMDMATKLRAFSERWLGNFPKPRLLIMDAAKAFSSETMHEFTSDLNIQMSFVVEKEA